MPRQFEYIKYRRSFQEKLLEVRLEINKVKAEKIRRDIARMDAPAAPKYYEDLPPPPPEERAQVIEQLINRYARIARQKQHEHPIQTPPSQKYIHE